MRTVDASNSAILGKNNHTHLQYVFSLTPPARDTRVPSLAYTLRNMRVQRKCLICPLSGIIRQRESIRHKPAAIFGPHPKCSRNRRSSVPVEAHLLQFRRMMKCPSSIMSCMLTRPWRVDWTDMAQEDDVAKESQALGREGECFVPGGCA